MFFLFFIAMVFSPCCNLGHGARRVDEALEGREQSSSAVGNSANASAPAPKKAKLKKKDKDKTKSNGKRPAGVSSASA